MNILIILCSLMLAALVIIAVFSILLYNRVIQLVSLNGAYQADEYRKAVTVQKHKKPTLPAVKITSRGRSVTQTDELVDVADMPWEDGYKALEEIGRG